MKVALVICESHEIARTDYLCDCTISSSRDHLDDGYSFTIFCKEAWQILLDYPLHQEASWLESPGYG
jgi:hypothetical protein